MANKKISELTSLTTPVGTEELMVNSGGTSKKILVSDLHKNMTVTGDITITGTVDGRDLATDGNKLDTIEDSADVTDTTNVVASLTAGTNVDISAVGVISSADTVYTHPTGSGNKHIPSGGSTNQVLTYSSAGTATWSSLAASGPGDIAFSGSGTITVPSGVNRMVVSGVGGGGGGNTHPYGGNTGGGGGAMAYGRILTVVAGNSVVIVQGSGGKSGKDAAVKTSGTATKFTASGGQTLTLANGTNAGYANGTAGAVSGGTGGITGTSADIWGVSRGTGGTGEDGNGKAGYAIVHGFYKA